MVKQQLVPVVNVCKHANIKMRYVCNTNALNLPATLTKVSSFETPDLGKCIIWKLYSHNCFLHSWCHCTSKVWSFSVLGSQTCKDIY